MASPPGDDDIAGSSGDAISFQLQSIDLPSRRLIGKGLSGVVYETIWKGERFARKDFVDVPSDLFLQEAAVLVNLKDHDNIVKTYGWTVDKRSCSLVLEYMDDDLLSLLKKITESKQDPAGVGFGNQSSASTSIQPFNLPDVLDIILQLAKGMESLHEQRIPHGDLKTKNILVTHVNDDGQKLVKVTDFGLVRTKRKSESNVSRQVRKLDIVKWKAPEYVEILLGTSTLPVVKVDAFAADVYSFAVTCSQILTGKDPYPNLGWKDLGDKILSGLRPNLPDAWPLWLRNLLILCWGDPAQRPTFSKICEEFQEHFDTFSVTGACKEQGGSSDSTLDEDQIQISSSSPRTRPLPYQFSKAAPSRVSMKSRLTGFLRLFKRKDSEGNHSSVTSKMSAERPQLYLDLTELCLEQAQSMAKVSTSLKFNHMQCIYLVDKLEMAVQSAHLLFYEQISTWNPKFDSAEDRARSLEIFKLLFVWGKEVESFVQACCRDMWVHSAITLINVFDQILSLGSNLELCTLVFRNLFGVLTLIEVAKVREREAVIVKERATLDELRLYEVVNDLIQSSREISRVEWLLGTFLLERLERQRQGNPDYASKRSHQPIHPDNIGRELILIEMEQENLKLVNLLGQGSMGTVYKAMWLGVEVAVKTFDEFSLEDYQEASILEGLCHPNIISLLGLKMKDNHRCHMIMELMDGDLFSLMRERMRMRYYDGSPFSISEAIHIMLQVAQGMLYLHDMKIIHRDLKSHNILVKYMKVAKVEVEFVHAKLSSFEQSKLQERDVIYSPITPYSGTTRWMAPEVIERRKHDDEGEKYPFKCDIYSFAMVCYEILTGNIPFEWILSLSEVKVQVLAGNRPRLPNECPDMLRKLIEACWHSDPRQRPNFQDICVKLRNLKNALFIESASLWMKSGKSKQRNFLTKDFMGKDALDMEPPRSVVKLQPPIDWVIGLHFGNTYSRFAYARVSDARDIFVHYNWPLKLGRPDCKTLTGLYYKRTESGHLECASWGYPAQSESIHHHGDEGLYLTGFMQDLHDPVLARTLPAPLTVTGVVTEYLKCIGEYALSVVREKGGDAVFSKDSVQWCVAVPSIWDETAKQQMKACMVNAGLVSAEAGRIEVVLEPEAASFHCLRILRGAREDVFVNAKDKILVADVGGCTVDFVVQELVGNSQEYQVKELTKSSGGLCGGTFVDESFMRFLSRKIGCLNEFLLKDCPSYKIRLLEVWEGIKCGFGHEMTSTTDIAEFDLHPKLAAKWEVYETKRGNALKDSSVVELTVQDLTSIFDPVVDKILELINVQLRQVPDIKVMFVVGGFAGSPYLMQRIRGRYSGKVQHIVSPPNPGSAIVQGAVSLALHPDAIVSRVSKKFMAPVHFDHALDPSKLKKIEDRPSDWGHYRPILRM